MGALCERPAAEIADIKNASSAGVRVQPWILAQQSCPAFHFVTAPLGFPLFQGFVVATLGFDDFAVVRVFILLDLARALGTGGFNGSSAAWLSAASLGVEQGNDVAQGLLVLTHQVAQFAFEF